VKYFILSSVVFTLSLCAQDSSVRTSTSVDINGRRVVDAPQIDQTKSKNSTETTEKMQSINGRMVPIERVEDRVVRDDASGRVVERLIRGYDATGNPTPPVKETIEEQKRPDGSSTIQTSRYQGDINGGMRLVEKSTTDIRKSGSTETSDTVLQRPSVNGSLETVEKRDAVRVKEGAGYREEATTYRRDGNGSFGVALRKTTEHIEQGGQATDNTADYEAGPDGRLQLHGQTVANIVTRPDGSKDSVVSIYGQNVPGTVDPTGRLKLYEQQLIEQKAGPGNTMVETLSVRRPTVSDPNTLGPTKQISETICKGKCGNGAQ
jgi:hypothetical protein